MASQSLLTGKPLTSTKMKMLQISRASRGAWACKTLEPYSLPEWWRLVCGLKHLQNVNDACIEQCTHGVWIDWLSPRAWGEMKMFVKGMRIDVFLIKRRTQEKWPTGPPVHAHAVEKSSTGRSCNRTPDTWPKSAVRSKKREKKRESVEGKTVELGGFVFCFGLPALIFLYFLNKYVHWKTGERQFRGFRLLSC